MRRVSGPALLGVLALLACSDSPADLPDLSVSTVSLSPVGQTLTAGQTMQLMVYPKAADGTVLGGRQTSWTTSAPGVATVSSTGMVQAVGAGNATITATVEGKAGSVQVSVVAAPLQVASVEITNAPANMEIGQQVMLEAKVRAADGTVLGGRAVTWRSSHSPYATVNVDPNPTFALLSAHSAGAVVITAESEGRTTSVAVTVNGPAAAVGSIVLSPSNTELLVNGSHTYEASVFTPTGAPHPNPPVLAWTVDDPSVAQVDANGRVRGLRAGTTHVRATAGGVQGAAQLTVVPFFAGRVRYLLRADVDPEGAPRQVELGTLTWYGESVEGVPAREMLTGGAITFETNAGVTTYAQQIYFDVVIVENGAERKVAFGSLSDSGTVTTHFDAASGQALLQFTSSNPQNAAFVGFATSVQGVIVRQALSAAPVLPYAWVRE